MRRVEYVAFLINGRPTLNIPEVIRATLPGNTCMIDMVSRDSVARIAQRTGHESFREWAQRPSIMVWDEREGWSFPFMKKGGKE